MKTIMSWMWKRHHHKLIWIENSPQVLRQREYENKPLDRQGSKAEKKSLRHMIWNKHRVWKQTDGLIQVLRQRVWNKHWVGFDLIVGKNYQQLKPSLKTESIDQKLSFLLHAAYEKSSRWRVWIVWNKPTTC